MNASNTNLLADLLELTKADGGLAQVLAQRKLIEKDLQFRMDNIRKLEGDVFVKAKATESKKELCKLEEKNLSEERSRVSDRRKALKGLGTYKLQQAAEREIDHTARELSQREEGLIKMIGDSEILEKDLATLKSSLAGMQAEFQKLEADAKETFANLDRRSKELQSTRDAVVTRLDPTSVAQYNKVRDKHAGSAVVEVKSNGCTGCFMQIGPQIQVQIQRAQTLQRCPGCGRILYLAEEVAEK